MTKKFGEDRVYLAYSSLPPFIIKGNQGRNSKQGRSLEAGADAEALEERHLLACS